MVGVARRGPRLHRELRKYIVDGERVVLAVRRHWFSMIHEIAYAATALVVAAVVDIAAPPTPGGKLLSDVTLAAVLAAALWLIWKFLNWRNEYFVATDKRFLLFYGFIRRKVAMMPLIKVTDLTFDRPLLGRLLGYGHFILESAGHDQALAQIGMIPHADENYRLICEQLFGDAHDVDPEDQGWYRDEGPSDGRPGDGDGGGWGGGGWGWWRRGGPAGSTPGGRDPRAVDEWNAEVYAARHNAVDHRRGNRGVSGDQGGVESWYHSDQRTARRSHATGASANHGDHGAGNARDTPDTGELLYVPREWT